MGEQDKVFYQYNGNSLAIEDWDSKREVSFEDLVQAIKVTHSATQAGAVKAINRMQTMRNWIVGYYIVEFEQKGKERAEYGEHLLEKLGKRAAVRGLTKEILSLCRSFYTIYPQMASLFRASSEPAAQILDSANQKLKMVENKGVTILDSVNQKLQSSPESIISKLSFSHIRALIPIADPMVRFFMSSNVCAKHGRSVNFAARLQVTYI